jgi:two-component system, chemotaxis family, CheB/CheR fusion protein
MSPEIQPSAVQPAVQPEDRVLILAPSGRDAALISSMLEKEGVPCFSSRYHSEWMAQFRLGASLAVIAEEALAGVNVHPLIELLREQPPWSDLPILLLTGSGAEESETSVRLVTLLGPSANITLLERPVRVATLLSSVRSALRARRRQYEMREYLAERKRSEEKLRQTQKLESLGVLAGGVAHDFNNLLTGIMGSASLAMDSLLPSDRHLRPILADVLAASESAADLTRQLLAYAGKGRFVIEPIQLSATVKAVTHMVQSSIPPNVDLHLNVDSVLPPIDADKTQIHQIVMNLLINAAEAIPSGRHGKVTVTTSTVDLSQPCGCLRPGPYVQIEVADNGIGMDEATQARIFDPFFTTKFMGRGLGLAAALGIVNGHKGSLTVSSAPGLGSTFRVLFPASSQAQLPARSPVSQNSQISKAGQTILVIDDEATVRRTAKATLERHGYQIVIAENGTECIEVFRAMNGRISAVLLDLTMPGMNGDEVLTHLKSIRHDVKVVLSSGYNESEVVRLFAGNPLSGFIQKPYTSSSLSKKMDDVLA